MRWSPDTKSRPLFAFTAVTGSGKTEVYLRAIVAARKERKGVHRSRPEIALTPQLVARFRARFGTTVAVLHSGLLPRERLVMWKRLRAGELDVAIGARSALFAPVCDLGLIVVDEEHDPSFKQEEGIRYHARDMAIFRAHRARWRLRFGQRHAFARDGAFEAAPAKRKNSYFPIAPRAADARGGDRRLASHGPRTTGDKRISLPLHARSKRRSRRAKQAISSQPPRISPAVRCEACGELCSCPSCSVALTFHKRHGERLRCHYCDYEIAPSRALPEMQKPCASYSRGSARRSSKKRWPTPSRGQGRCAWIATLRVAAPSSNGARAHALARESTSSWARRW